MTKNLTQQTATKYNALKQLWLTWSPEVLADFCVALVIWCRGEGYMYSGDDDEEFQELTPFDFFASNHPTEFTQYSTLIDQVVSRKDLALYRTVLFEQADELIDEIGNETDVAVLAASLTEQNTLTFSSGGPVSAYDFADFSGRISVRKFSSWTLSPRVAYRLSFEGGMYQIGEGAVLVRAEPAATTVVHTTLAGKLFEQFMREHPARAKLCPPFMERWLWQKEYVVYAPQLEVAIDGLLVASIEGYEFYERIMDRAEVQD